MGNLKQTRFLVLIILREIHMYHVHAFIILNGAHNSKDSINKSNMVHIHGSVQ